MFHIISRTQINGVSSARVKRYLYRMNGKEIEGKSVFMQKARPRDKESKGKQFGVNKNEGGCFNCGEPGHFAR